MSDCNIIDFPSNAAIGDIHTQNGQTWVFTAFCIQSVECVQGVQCPGTWNLKTTSVITSTGAQGTTGPQGTIGTQGIQGIQGRQGIQGIQGITGSGSQGTIGTQGIQGITGSGAQGTIGTQGIQGRQGTSGAISAVTSSTSSPFYLTSLPTLDGQPGSVQGSNGIFMKPSDGSFSATQGITSLVKPVFNGVPQIRSEGAGYTNFYTYNTGGGVQGWSPARTDGVQGPLYVLAASSTWDPDLAPTNPSTSNCVPGQLILVPEA